MTLILAMRAETGELVIAADRRTTVPFGDEAEDGKLVLDDYSPKLIDFDGAVIGVSGKCGTALYVIRQFVIDTTREKNACERLSETLTAYYEKRFAGDRSKWPHVQITYCDWQGQRARIVRMQSGDGFVPEDRDISAHVSGKGGTALALYYVFGVGRSSVADLERFCLLAFALTAAMDTSVGGRLDVWVLSKSGIVKHTESEIADRFVVAQQALTSAQEILYR